MRHPYAPLKRVASHQKRLAFRAAIFAEALEIDVVERLDHRATLPQPQTQSRAASLVHGVCDRDLVTELRESSRERSTDHAGADDSASREEIDSVQRFARNRR